MAEEIIIKTVLDLSGSERQIKQQVEKALGSPDAQTAARNAGKKIGDALGLGIETTRRSREDKELAHMRRLETISAQSNARLIQIEARKQAQLDTIRERSFQKEIEHQRKIERETQRGANALTFLRNAASGLRSVFGALAALGIVALFERIGRAALGAAIDIDKQVSALTALTGSAAAAEKRFAQLIAIAQKTPGLTTNLAATLDVQLRIFNVAQQTIDKLLPVIGRLNAISPIADPRQFVNNLTQLISQNFERQDLKELVGQSPIAGQLIKGIFDVDNPTNAAAIRAAAKRLGITTVERLAEELIKEAANNPALKNAVETLGGQFDKLQDRINVALAPIGKELANFLIPTFKELIPLAEDFGSTLNRSLQDNRGEIAQFRKAVVDLAAAFTSLGKISIPILGEILQAAANGVGFYADLANMFRGDFSFSNSRANFGNMLPGGGVPSAQNRAAFAGAPSRFELLGAVTPTGGARTGGGGGGGGGDGRVSKAAKERARQIAEMQEKIRDAMDEFGKGLVEDLEKISKEINEANAQFKKDANFRARRLIEQRETRRQLTAEFEAREVETLQRTSRRGFQRSGRFIEDAITRGQLTAGEAELLQQGAAGDFANQLREVLAIKEKMVGVDKAVLDDLRDEIDLYSRLSVAVSNTERFMRGFNSQIETVGDAFERFGANVSRAFGNVRDLFNGLKQAVLGFFNDLLGGALQNIVRSVLGPIFGGGGGRGGSRLGGILGGLLGGGGISAPASVSGAGGVASSFSSAIGGGSVFSGGFGSIFPGGTAGGIGGFSLSGLGGALAGAAPLLGLSLGSALGGTSTTGKILGAIGGGAVGVGALFGASVFGAGGGLAQAALAALGPAALIGAPLLVGAILLGKAAQRRKDEQASGEMLTAALAGITQLRDAITSDQIDGGQARSIFESQILGTFISGINTLKTKSVRESRLTNQVADLRKVYDDVIPPAIAAQALRRSTSESNALTHSRLIPEFATGGTARGGLALLHPGEKVLNLQQQSAIRTMAGPSVFERAGVPGVQHSRVFDGGGIMPMGAQMQPIEITLEAQVIIGKGDATKIVVVGGSTPQGRVVTVRNVKEARTNREL